MRLQLAYLVPVLVVVDSVAGVVESVTVVAADIVEDRNGVILDVDSGVALSGDDVAVSEGFVVADGPAGWPAWTVET